MSNKSFYVLKVFHDGDLAGYADYSSGYWTFGHPGFDIVPDGVRRLTLKEAQNGKKAISKWKRYSDLTFEIVKFTVDVSEEVV